MAISLLSRQLKSIVIPTRHCSQGATFEKLLRYSGFINLGIPQNRIVIGKIYYIIGDDLYVDFGGKFHCVVRRPKNSEKYVRGAKVKLKLNDWELTARFLGSSKDMTLLESDCILLGLA